MSSVSDNNITLQNLNKQLNEIIEKSINLENKGQLAEAVEACLECVKLIHSYKQMLASDMVNGEYGISAQSLENLSDTGYQMMQRAIVIAQLMNRSLPLTSLSSMDLSQIDNDLRRELDRVAAEKEKSEKSDSNKFDNSQNIDEFDLDQDVERLGNGLFEIVTDFTPFIDKINTLVGYKFQRAQVEQLLTVKEHTIKGKTYDNSLLPVSNNQNYETYKGIKYIPNGKTSNIMLYGPPGTGKTENMYYFARKMGANLMIVNTSSFLQTYSGVGEGKMRLMAQCARLLTRQTNKQTYVMMDELDGVIGDRSTGDLKTWDQSRITTLLQILLPNDKKDNSQVHFFAATNVPDTIDRAIVSRFNTVLFGYISDPKERADLFKNEIGDFLKNPEEACTLAGKLYLEFVPRDIRNFHISDFALAFFSLNENERQTGISTKKLIQLLAKRNPSTTIENYLRIYKPTLADTVDLINNNQKWNIKSNDEYANEKKAFNSVINKLIEYHKRLVEEE